MKKSRIILFLVTVCAIVVFILVSTHSKSASSRGFVDYMLSHADEATVDFEGSGIVFSAAKEEPNTLTVTFPDGRCFYYQTLAEHEDQLVKIECSVEKERGGELLTGSLEILRRGSKAAHVSVRCDDEKHWEIRTLNYSVPEFDMHENTFKSEDTAQRISQWISNEELSALYKEGKEFEEILTGYCMLKSHNVDVNIYDY